MRADLTRVTFNPFKHFTRVLIQQGRVENEADPNEQTAILLHYLQNLAADIIGPHGGPKDNEGFGISTSPYASDFVIGAGHYYVGGVLCESASTEIPIIGPPPSSDPRQVQVSTMWVDGQEFEKNQFVQITIAKSPPSNTVLAQITDTDPENRILTLDQDVAAFRGLADSPVIQRMTTYMNQPDFPVPNDQALLSNKWYQVYLDVWERTINYLEDDSIREVALGGPDTASRAKIVCQVKVTPSGGSAVALACAEQKDLEKQFQGTLRGRLRAKSNVVSVPLDPCLISPSAKYRGAENQLYRLEVHRPGIAWDGDNDVPKANAATFKVSRENGSVVFAIRDLVTVAGANTTTLTLESLGRDDRLGLTEGDWVEIQDDDYVLQNRAEPLLQVISIDRTAAQVVLAGQPVLEVGRVPSKHPLLRRWDQQQGDPGESGLELSDGTALIQESDIWLNLEDGVQVQFQAADNGQSMNYRTGDYWLIPARVATGSVEWPIALDEHGNPVQDDQGNTIPIALPPKGIKHLYAPLAVVSLDGNGKVQFEKECRKPFSAATMP
jgi:hypothetical protein